MVQPFLPLSVSAPLGEPPTAPWRASETGGSSPPWLVAATMRRAREEFAIFSGKQVDMMTVRSGFAAVLFSARHQLLKKQDFLVHPFNRMKTV